MIRLIRDRKKIPKAFLGKERVAKNQILLEARLAGISLDNKFWKGKDHWKKAKTQLRAEASGKCAYCDSPAAVVTHADVEHYRPKDIYWWLAYCYDNYLYSCQICNQSFKGNQFPVRGAALAEPTLTPEDLTPDPLLEESVEAQLRGEDAGLLNPYFDDPDRHFAWTVDDDLKEVRLSAVHPPAGFQVESAEKYYGLNREELRRLRYQIYEVLAGLRVFRDNPSMSAKDRTLAAKMMQALAEDDRPYAGMVRYFLRLWYSG
jgi:uncharacterized protein (TIGR02646 family)